MGLPRHEEEEFARIAAGLHDLSGLAGPSALHPSALRAIVASVVVVALGNLLMVVSIAIGAWPVAVPCFLLMAGVVAGIWQRQAFRAAQRRRLLQDLRS